MASFIKPPDSTLVPCWPRVDVLPAQSQLISKCRPGALIYFVGPSLERTIDTLATDLLLKKITDRCRFRFVLLTKEAVTQYGYTKFIPREEELAEEVQKSISKLKKQKELLAERIEETDLSDTNELSERFSWQTFCGPMHVSAMGILLPSTPESHEGFIAFRPVLLFRQASDWPAFLLEGKTHSDIFPIFEEYLNALWNEATKQRIKRERGGKGGEGDPPP